MQNHRLLFVAGLLVILSLVAGLASVAPSIDAGDYLSAAPAAALQVKLAAVAQLVMALAYLWFAAVFYPLLRQHGAELAIVFLGARLVAVGLSVVSTIVMLILLGIAQQSQAQKVADLAVIAGIGDVLKLNRDYINHFFMITVFGSGNAIFYLLAMRAGVLPRWLAIWGMIGAIFAITASVLFFFGAFEVITASYLAMNAPAVTSELLLAYWLIVRGGRKSQTDGMATNGQMRANH